VKLKIVDVKLKIVSLLVAVYLKILTSISSTIRSDQPGQRALQECLGSAQL
jgi:hypothetical protein